MKRNTIIWLVAVLYVSAISCFSIAIWIMIYDAKSAVPASVAPTVKVMVHKPAEAIQPHRSDKLLGFRLGNF